MFRETGHSFRRLIASGPLISRWEVVRIPFTAFAYLNRREDMFRNVLITGVSSGIGLGLAREYLAQGVQVFGLSRREPEEFTGQGNFRFESADLRKSEEATKAIGRLLKGVDRLDVVILNAGILGRVADMGEITVEEFREVIEVNLLANKVLLDAVFAEKYRCCKWLRCHPERRPRRIAVGTLIRFRKRH